VSNQLAWQRGELVAEEMPLPAVDRATGALSTNYESSSPIPTFGRTHRVWRFTARPARSLPQRDRRQPGPSSHPPQRHFRSVAQSNPVSYKGGLAWDPRLSALIEPALFLKFCTYYQRVAAQSAVGPSMFTAAAKDPENAPGVAPVWQRATPGGCPLLVHGYAPCFAGACGPDLHFTIEAPQLVRRPDPALPAERHLYRVFGPGGQRPPCQQRK